MKSIYLLLLLLVLAASLTSQVTQFGQPEFFGPYYTPNTSGSVWTIVPMNGSLNSQYQRIRISTGATWINTIPTYSLVSQDGGWYYYQINVSRSVNNTIYNRESQFSIVLQNIEDGVWYNVPGVFINDYLFQYGMSQSNSTIQNWINNAADNSVISIPQNTYYGSINISSRVGLVLQGDNSNNNRPSFIGTGYQTVINISNSSNISIRNLKISNGSGLDGGGFVISNSTGILIDNCHVYNNVARAYYSGGALPGDSHGGAAKAINSSLYFYDTVLYGNNASIGCTVYLSGGNISFEKCSLDQLASNPASYSVYGDNGFTHTYLNSIIKSPYDTNGTYNLCCLYNTNLQLWQFSGYGKFIADPMFVYPATNDYSLQKGSPCIGTGYNDLYWDPQGSSWNQDWLTVHDETQDIGAIPYDYDRYCTYSFTNDGQGNWKCFPVIDDYTTINIGGTNYRTDNMRAFFRQYDGLQSQMTQVDFRWFDATHPLDTYHYYPNAPITWHYMEGDIGYLAVFNQNSVMPANNEKYHGYHIPYDSPVSVPYPNTEHWIGYFIPETQVAQVAFGTFLDELYYIQHKNWTMVRVKPKRGSSWIVTLGSGQRSPTLSYGDMVIVKKFGADLPTYPEIDEFVWYRYGAAQQFTKEDPTYFSFNKEPEYTAIFVQMDSLSTAQEIAVVSDGVCYGAAVVENDLVMIPAFISSLPDGSELQLVTWDGAKAASNPISFNRYDTNSDQFVTCNNLIKQDCDFYYISTGNNNNSAPEISSISISNYPNPFTPSTTINYSIPKEGNVIINIYNIKGQIVKTLVSESLKSGTYSIVWNGDDQNGKKVSAGLYFTRIQAQGKALTNKMVKLR